MEIIKTKEILDRLCRDKMFILGDKPEIQVMVASVEEHHNIPNITEKANLTQGEADEESVKQKEQMKKSKAKWINEKNVLNDNLMDARNKLEQERKISIELSNEKAALNLERTDLANEVDRLEKSIDNLENMLKQDQDESAQKIKQMEEIHSDNLEKLRLACNKEAQVLNEKYEENIEAHRQESQKRMNNLRKLNPDKAAMSDMENKYRNKYEDELKNVDILRNTVGSYHKEIKSLNLQLKDEMAAKVKVEKELKSHKASTSSK